MSVYVAWSYPGEANRDPTVLDNRFSTMTEVRRVFWPAYEEPQWSDPLEVPAGDRRVARAVLLGVGEVPASSSERSRGTSSRCSSASTRRASRLPLDERVLADTDTLFVFGLDHLVTEQVPLPEEIEAVREFLAREGTCLVLGPHHDVGRSDDLKRTRHGVPSPRRRARAATATVRRVHARADEGTRDPRREPVGASPGRRRRDERIAPLTDRCADLDERGWLAGVRNFNFHMHLPHYALTTEDTRSIHVLARQPIDLSRPHPFTEAGNEEFNALVWMPPGDRRAGDVLVVDSTVFSTLFGSDESLERFWKNLATAQ